MQDECQKEVDAQRLQYDQELAAHTLFRGVFPTEFPGAGINTPNDSRAKKGLSKTASEKRKKQSGSKVAPAAKRTVKAKQSTLSKSA
jgi:hypothetical protein